MDDFAGAPGEHPLCWIYGDGCWYLCRCRRISFPNANIHHALSRDVHGRLALRSAAMDNPSITRLSFAKINWSLRVLGKRPDGYHDISTVLQTISLADEIRFTHRDDDSFV